MSKKTGKKGEKGDRSKGTAKSENGVPSSKEPTPTFTEEQLSNPLFRAALQFRNNPSLMSSNVISSLANRPPDSEETRPNEAPNFMQRLVARASNDANALCILGLILWNQVLPQSLHFLTSCLLVHDSRSHARF
jgi:hypothetical protein